MNEQDRANLAIEGSKLNPRAKQWEELGGGKNPDLTQGDEPSSSVDDYYKEGPFNFFLGEDGKPDEELIALHKRGEDAWNAGIGEIEAVRFKAETRNAGIGEIENRGLKGTTGVDGELEEPTVSLGEEGSDK